MMEDYYREQYTKEQAKSAELMTTITSLNASLELYVSGAGEDETALVMRREHDVVLAKVAAGKEVSLAWIPHKGHAIAFSVGIALGAGVAFL